MMTEYFNKEKISNFYPEAENLMFPAMRIWKLPDNKQDMLSEVCFNGEYFLTEKIDGAFYQFVKTETYSYLFGRTISKTTGLLTEKGDNIPHIRRALSCLPPKTILIGEIFVPGGTAKDTVHIMGCLPEEAVKRQTKEGLIKYYIHDIIYYDGVNLINVGAERRYNILKAIWKLHNLDEYDFLVMAEKVTKNLEVTISYLLDSGAEGVVLKKKDAVYSPDKRPAWATIKIKQMDSIDLICMGLCAPTREYTGKDEETWPYWTNGDVMTDICMCGKPDWEPITKYYYLGLKTAIKIGAYGENGELKELGTVSSGLTDEDRKEMTYSPERWIGNVVSLDCMSLNRKDHTLRHPVFKRLRLDKNPQECLISEIFA